MTTFSTLVDARINQDLPYTGINWALAAYRTVSGGFHN